MNKQIIIVGIVLLILIGGGIYFAAGQSPNKQSQTALENIEETGEESPEHIAQEKKNAAGQSTDNEINNDESSRYIEYSKAELEENKDKRRVLYFYASWCPTCRIADPDLKANVNRFPEDLVVLRVNYNDPDTDQEEKELAKKYGITYQHTFVQIDSQGKEITKWNGGKTDELLSNIKI